MTEKYRMGEDTGEKKEEWIRLANMEDLDAVTELEACCFPPAEAAPREAFAERLAVFADCFWLMFQDGEAVSMINGMMSEERFLSDAMYEKASMHDPEADWLMVFGVLTRPEHQGKGCASRLMRHVIKDVKSRGKKGLVLTCKEEKITFYEQFGFANEGKSDSDHGGAVWYQMRLKL